jgi:hypothetical protein
VPGKVLAERDGESVLAFVGHSVCRWSDEQAEDRRSASLCGLPLDRGPDTDHLDIRPIAGQTSIDS